MKKKSRTGRKSRKPDYDAASILQEQMGFAVQEYEAGKSLQSIADTLSLNPIKVRKLLITAGIYKSETADAVRDAFEAKQGMPYKEKLEAVAAELDLSRASVTSYLPYKKGVYFPAECDKSQISIGAERLRRMRQRKKAVEALQENLDEEHLWDCILAFQGYRFKTFSGLPFAYTVRRGRNGEYTRELWIDRRENSKSLVWSSVLRIFEKVKGGKIEVDRPKALGDIRGVTYIYSMFLRFGLIGVDEKTIKKSEVCKK